LLVSHDPWEAASLGARRLDLTPEP
jgi:hypothetical protein